MPLDRNALDEALSAAKAQLMASLLPSGHWEGELSSSALSTATAATALALADKAAHEPLIRRGLDWLAANRDRDGGWGDTVLSRSNLSTTALCWAAFGAAGALAEPHRQAIADAEAWLVRAAGSLEPPRLAQAIADRYGKDRTFSVPILTMCALAGRLGPGREAWRLVKPLPFELAACPHRWFKWLRLPVVSYALPALIAIGQARFCHAPPRNPFARLVRHLTRRRTLRILSGIQPESGGFLEAIPLTSFVVMSLASVGERSHPVVVRGVEFLRRAARPDGSWPIDTHLATWVTTLAVNALAANPDFLRDLPVRELRDWLLGQQHLREHPYTHADPGGWAWTDLSGGVPDADDSAGALLALRNLAPSDGRAFLAATLGIDWLLHVQNRDGGIPTFCRGWGKLPFDRSAADLTAHALLAWSAWLDGLPPALKRRTEAAIPRALAFLASAQRADGSWVPLWFGNEAAPSEENPTYGTARVVMALAALSGRWPDRIGPMLQRGVEWLLAAQSPDGGWGGAPGVPSSIEETALAVDALARVSACGYARPTGTRVADAISEGVRCLLERTNRGRQFPSAPIGFYFARLWYFERLYPLIFTLSALLRARARVEGQGASGVRH
jgi:squalene-hopene/tetraprenyl-beta-curcumene cyclase